MSGPKNALAAWSRSALRYVELPTGTKALVVLPDVMTLVKSERLPAELREMAFKYAKDGINVAQLPDEDLGKFVHFTYELVANMLRYLAAPDSEAQEPGDPGWEPVRLTAGELREMEIDQADLDALGQIAGRVKSPNEVTAMSRFDRGLMDKAIEAAAADAASGELTRAGDLAGFRGQSGGAARGDDGEDVREEPERVPRRAGSRARLRR